VLHHAKVPAVNTGMADFRMPQSMTRSNARTHERYSLLAQDMGGKANRKRKAAAEVVTAEEGADEEGEGEGEGEEGEEVEVDEQYVSDCDTITEEDFARSTLGRLFGEPPDVARFGSKLQKQLTKLEEKKGAEVTSAVTKAISKLIQERNRSLMWKLQRARHRQS
jgi:hypothetical protein